MNLAEELFATEGCILELEDSTTEGNNDTTRRRTMALVAIFRASLHSSPQERIALQYLQGKVNYQERLIQSVNDHSDKASLRFESKGIKHLHNDCQRGFSLHVVAKMLKVFFSTTLLSC